ncbi:MAG: flagellar basal body rod protein FlgC [Myxococcota bacterium]
MSNLFTAFRVSASGMSAQRARINATSSNIANMQTTRSENGGAYQRMDPVFRTVEMGDDVYGVEVTEVARDQSPPRRVFDPGHPDADPEGYVEMPNINLVEEMVNMITAQRAYEANTSVVDSTKKMARAALSMAEG